MFRSAPTLVLALSVGAIWVYVISLVLDHIATNPIVY